jgi:hypothetical protein
MKDGGGVGHWLELIGAVAATQRAVLNSNPGPPACKAGSKIRFFGNMP